MAKHTPGPWATIGVDNSRVTGPRSEHICSAWLPRKTDEAQDVGESWLAMRDRTAPQREVIDKEMRANARLIAAAPELLDALKDAEAEIACADRASTHILEKVRAVIAKATGAA